MPTALLRFQLATAAAVALRAAVPVAAALTVAAVLAPSPAAALAALLGSLVGPGTGPIASAGVLAVLLGVATAVVRRAGAGLGGWTRSLPASGRAHRAALILAVGIALAPVPLAAAAAALAAGIPLDLARSAGLVVAGFAAPLVVLPVRRRLLTAPLALASAWLALEPGWGSAAAAAVLAGAAFASGGEGRARTRRSRSAVARRRSGLPLWIAVRAVAWRAAGPAAAAGVVLLGGLAFVANNELSPPQTDAAWRLAGLASSTVVCAGLAELLAVRRPTWPWARSLPASSTARVLSDAALLAAPGALPLVVVAAADAAAALAGLAACPAVALLASGAVRRAAERASGAAGEVLAGGLLAAAWIALLPDLAWGLLAASPLLLRWAAARDRALRVSSWLERHHLAAGDPAAWSDRG